MKYKVTLNNRVYEVEVEQGEAMLVDEYELAAPAAPAAAVEETPCPHWRRSSSCRSGCPR